MDKISNTNEHNHSALSAYMVNLKTVKALENVNQFHFNLIKMKSLILSLFSFKASQQAIQEIVGTTIFSAILQIIRLCGLING